MKCLPIFLLEVSQCNKIVEIKLGKKHINTDQYFSLKYRYYIFWVF